MQNGYLVYAHGCKTENVTECVETGYGRVVGVYTASILKSNKSVEKIQELSGTNWDVDLHVPEPYFNQYLFRSY